MITHDPENIIITPNTETIAKNINIPAALADQCLRSIPFTKTYGNNVLQLVRDFMQLYSAQAFWKTPPSSELNLTAVNLNTTFDRIATQISKNVYSSTYDFDLTMTEAFGSFYDGHTTYGTRCSNAFIFFHDCPLVSIALTPDGQPKVFLGDPATGGPVAGAQVAGINGADPEAYLINLAQSNPLAYFIDLDTRYNSLFIQRIPSSLSSYPGDNLGVFAVRHSLPPQSLSIELLNGTTIEVEWKALYVPANASSGSFASLPFNNVAGFKNYCGFASLNNVNASASAPSLRKRSGSLALPRWEPPILRKSNRIRSPLPSQHNTKASLDVNAFKPTLQPVAIKALPHGEAAYFILRNDAGVIVLSRFQPAADSTEELLAFAQDMAHIVRNALAYFKKKGLQKVLVDVSRNPGGSIPVGFAIFQQFFPLASPYNGGDLRYSPALLDLVAGFTNMNIDGELFTLDSHLEANGSQYSSVSSFLGPVYKDGDYFTTLSRSNVQAVIASLYGPGNVSLPASAPFAAENIALLSDSICASTCATFAEAMLEQGVRTIVYGGRPGRKTLQLSGGVRG